MVLTRANLSGVICSPGWLMVLAQEVPSSIRNCHPCLIRVNCTEREILSWRRRFGHTVEERRFSAEWHRDWWMCRAARLAPISVTVNNTVTFVTHSILDGYRGYTLTLHWAIPLCQSWYWCSIFPSTWAVPQPPSSSWVASWSFPTKNYTP